MMLGVVSYSNAFSITDYYHEQSRCHYKAYCFNKEEAARLRPWVAGAADLSALVSAIPGVGTVTATIVQVLAQLGKAVLGHTTVGWTKGFSINVPTPHNLLEYGRVPFLWESNG